MVNNMIYYYGFCENDFPFNASSTQRDSVEKTKQNQLISNPHQFTIHVKNAINNRFRGGNTSHKTKQHYTINATMIAKPFISQNFSVFAIHRNRCCRHDTFVGAVTTTKFSEDNKNH
jgi:hypothetical protein